MIQSTFSILCLSGKPFKPSIQYLDSRASNHMTFSSENLACVKKYNGALQTHNANGESLSIDAIGYNSHPLQSHNVFFFLFSPPLLATNLLSVDQLLENNCTISFSSFGSLLQDQTTGKTIRKGPKCE